MPRPFIRTRPVTVEDKQFPVIPQPYPLPNVLAPIPDDSPYTVGVEAKQPYVEPVQSALANTLTGLSMRDFLSPQAPSRPPVQPYSMPPPPDTTQGGSQREPALFSQLRSPTQPMRNFAVPDQAPVQTPTPRLGEPPLPGTQQPPAPNALLSGMMSRMGQPLREFTPRPDAKTGSYITALSPQEEAQFQAWVRDNRIPFNPSSLADYDMRGFFRDKPAMQEREARIAQGGSRHFPDTYKTPYHQSFSNESVYATPDAPRWDGDRLVDRSGRVVFDETGQGSLPGEPPATHPYSPPQQILRSIGIPQALHKVMAPAVARTFPKAVAPEQPVTHPTQPTPPPKTFRASPTTVQDTMKFSPMRQAATPSGRKVVVSLPDKKVVVYNSDGSILREYSVYIGKASDPTPRGQFRIMENIKPAESEWYYGGHWLGFAYGYGKGEKPGKGPSYAGFHGWVYSKEDESGEREEPGWKTSTHGCIQLGNKDVADLASLVGAGDPVTILDTPFAPPPPRPPTVQMRPVGFLQNLVGR